MQGLQLLKDNDDSGSRLDRLEKALAEDRKRQDKDRERIDGYKKRVDELSSKFSIHQDVFVGIRQRFLETFRRDVLQDDPTRASKDNIRLGNDYAHRGHAAMDYLLYADGVRHDEQLMVSVYGLLPEEIRFLGK